MFLTVFVKEIWMLTYDSYFLAILGYACLLGLFRAYSQIASGWKLFISYIIEAIILILAVRRVAIESFDGAASLISIYVVLHIINARSDSQSKYNRKWLFADILRALLFVLLIVFFVLQGV
jgi:hypothetical protein